MASQPPETNKTKACGDAAQQIGADTEQPRPPKRARVAVACTRCKTRKQKCDGKQPRCGNCKNIAFDCEYVTPAKALPYGKYEYVKALEAKVAELQSILIQSGRLDMGKEQLQKLQSPAGDGMNAFATARGQAHSTTSSLAANVLSPELGGETQSNSLQSDRSQESIATYARDLSLDAGGGYVGEGSSNITVGKIFGAMLKGKELPDARSAEHGSSQMSPKSMTFASDQDYVELGGAGMLARTSASVANTMLVGYIKHISTRWPILHTRDIQLLASRRLELEDPFEISTLCLVYAIGARFLETTGAPGAFWPEQHYQNAMRHLDTILQTHNMRAVQTLLLHAVYCLRAPRRPGAWTYIGLAMRICIELGYHRRIPSYFRPRLAAEMRRRIFWSCYCLDRQVSIILGRPFTISDRDIDVELPWDVDEASSGEALEAIDPSAINTTGRSTSMSSFIHIVRLRRIESSIQQCVYRVDKTPSLPINVIDRFLEELAEWKARIPLDNRPVVDSQLSSFDGESYHLVYYYKALRLLLYPHLSNKNVDTRILLKCVEACGGVCKTYQRLHRQTSVGFSLMALYSIFLAGLTLIYCIWLSPLEVFTINTNNDLNSCSIVLYVITERWPGARKYRDAFESIKQCVLDFVAAGDQQPRQPLTGLDASLRATLEDVQNLHPEGKEDFGRMISDMLDESAKSPAVTMGDAGPQAGIGISEFQAQALYGQQFPYQSVPMAGGAFDGQGEGYNSMPMSAADLYDGFDMEVSSFTNVAGEGPITNRAGQQDFLSNPTGSWGVTNLQN